MDRIALATATPQPVAGPRHAARPPLFLGRRAGRVSAAAVGGGRRGPLSAESGLCRPFHRSRRLSLLRTSAVSDTLPGWTPHRLVAYHPDAVVTVDVAAPLLGGAPAAAAAVRLLRAPRRALFAECLEEHVDTWVQYTEDPSLCDWRFFYRHGRGGRAAAAAGRPAGRPPGRPPGRSPAPPPPRPRDPSSTPAPVPGPDRSLPALEGIATTRTWGVRGGEAGEGGPGAADPADTLPGGALWTPGPLEAAWAAAERDRGDGGGEGGGGDGAGAGAEAAGPAPGAGGPQWGHGPAPTSPPLAPSAADLLPLPPGCLYRERHASILGTPLSADCAVWAAPPGTTSPGAAPGAGSVRLRLRVRLPGLLVDHVGAAAVTASLEESLRRGLERFAALAEADA